MRRAGQAAAGLLGAFAIVAALLAGLLLALGLLHGEVTVRLVIGGVLGAAAFAAAVRFVPSHRLLGGYAALVYALLFVPILVVVIYAFNGGRYVTVWEGFSTRWFSAALQDEQITESILRSLRIAVASSVISTVLGTCAALALVRLRVSLRTPFETVVLLTIVLPEVVLAIAVLTFFANTGFTLGSVAMLAGHTIFNLSYVILLVRSRFIAMGDTLEQASRDLGAGPIATFLQVTLPQLAPAVLAGALLTFTFSFDDVVMSNFVSGSGNDTWPLRVLSSLRFGVAPNLNAAATMMLGVTLMALVLVGLILRRGAVRTRHTYESTG
jgi:spermidine/putrescine transport system permease protein/putrescine transport system permease protein